MSYFERLREGGPLFTHPVFKESNSEPAEQDHLIPLPRPVREFTTKFNRAFPTTPHKAHLIGYNLVFVGSGVIATECFQLLWNSNSQKGLAATLLLGGGMVIASSISASSLGSTYLYVERNCQENLRRD